MYEPRNNTQLGAVPDWLKRIAGTVVRGTTVTVPTPAGPIVVDLGNPDSVAAAKRAITGVTVNTNVGPKPPTPLDQVNAALSSAPGGIAGVALLGLGLFAVAKLARGR